MILTMKNSKFFSKLTFLKKVLVLCFFFVSQTLFAQNLHLCDSFDLPKPEWVSADKYGNFYIADQQGNLHQYDSTGKLLLSFSPEKVGSISLLEARQTVRIFAFYRDFQQIIWLDRFLKKIESYDLENENVGFVRLAAPSPDNRLWILNDSDFSLLKFDPRTHQTLFKISLQWVLPPADYDFVYLTEYQNLLFLQDRSGKLLVFDNLGNYRQVFDLPAETSWISFWKNSFYYLEKNTLKSTDFYTSQTQTYFLPAVFLEKIYWAGHYGLGFREANIIKFR